MGVIFEVDPKKTRSAPAGVNVSSRRALQNLARSLMERSSVRHPPGKQLVCCRGVPFKMRAEIDRQTKKLNNTQSSNALAPFICRLFNASLRSGRVPQSFKSTYIAPLLKKVLTTPTWRIIDPSPTSRSFPSCWNALFCGGYSSISRSTIFFSSECAVRLSQVSFCRNRDCKSAIGYPDGTRPWRRGNIGPAAPVGFVGHADTVDHCILLRRLCVSYGIRGAASARTWPIDSSASGMMECNQRTSSSSSGCLKALSSDHRRLYRYTADLAPLIAEHRLHAVVVITFLIETSKSGTTLSIRSSQPETLVCTSTTVVWRWGHTSTTCCRRVMVHWDSSGRLRGLCHHMHWTLSLPVSYTAGRTTATLFLLVYQLATFNTAP